MKKKLFVILLCITSLVGCTSMQSIDSGSTRLTDHLEVGDRLIVQEKSGRTLAMSLLMFDEEQIIGAICGDPRRQVEIMVADIEKIEVEKLDGGMTALAVVGGTVAVITVVPLLLAAAMGDS